MTESAVASEIEAPGIELDLLRKDNVSISRIPLIGERVYDGLLGAV